MIQTIFSLSLLLESLLLLLFTSIFSNAVFLFLVFFFSLSLRCNVPHSLDFFFFKVHFSLLLPKSSQVTNIRYLRFSRVLPQILLLTGLEVSITHLLSWSCWCTPGLLLYCSLQWPPTSGFRFLLLKACLLHCNITAV